MDAPPIQYVKTRDGYSIAYCVDGDGPPLIFTSFSFSHTEANWSIPLWRQTYLNLASAFRLVRFDSRGQGGSTRGLPETTVFDDFVSDLEALIEGLALTDVVLLGQLQHGKTAFEYAIRHPERVRALVLWNSHPSRPRTGAYGAGVPLAAANWDYLVESTVRTAFPQEDSAVQATVARQAIQPDDFIRTVGALSSHDVSGRLDSCRVPTLVITSRDTSWPFASEEGARAFTAGIAGARMLVFDDIGGGLYTASPELPPAVVAIRDFVAALPAKGAGSDAAAWLSQREVEVLRLIARGSSNAQIADALVISPHTVARHVSNILDKIGAANRAEASVYAVKNGIE